MMQNVTARRGIGRIAVRLLSLLAVAVMLSGVLAVSASAQDGGYQLRGGDVLRIEVLEDASLNRSVLVAPDGRVSLPLAGTVAAGGRTVEQVQADLTSRLAPNFAAPPTVFVSLERLADRGPEGAGGIAASNLVGVYVMGEAGRPGRMEIEPHTTVLQGFAVMGGFTKFAAKKRIQLRRDGKVYPLNYVAIENGTSTAGAMQLQEGDVIVIPQRRLFE